MPESCSRAGRRGSARDAVRAADLQHLLLFRSVSELRRGPPADHQRGGRRRDADRGRDGVAGAGADGRVRDHAAGVLQGQVAALRAVVDRLGPGGRDRRTADAGPLTVRPRRGRR